MVKRKFEPKCSCLDEMISLMPRVGDDGLVDDGPLETRLCTFEKLYFESIESDANLVSSIRFRARQGRYLSHLPEHIDKENIVVVPIPNSGRAGANGYANEYGYKKKEGFKKKYKKRVFITDENERKDLADNIYRPILSVFYNKHVVLFDDSIVRGDASSRLIVMALEAGALSVYFKSSAPPIKFPCYCGIDMKKETDLIAANKTIDEIHEKIFNLCRRVVKEKYVEGKYADEKYKDMLSKINKEYVDIEYASLDNLKKCANSFFSNKKRRWCYACFDGDLHILKGNYREPETINKKQH